MPQLVKLQEEMKDSGFLVIGLHAQNGTKEEVANKARSLKINFPVFDQGSIPGQKVDGIPALFLFDSSGKLVGSGRTELKAKAHELAQSEPHFLAAGMKYTKHKATADSLKKSKAYGSILKKLEKDLKAEGATGAEAKYLSERITAHGKRQMEVAKDSEKEDAFMAMQTWNDLSTQYKGHEIGNDAAKRLKELKVDKAFQEELKASTMAQQIVGECNKLIAQGGKIDLEYAVNKPVAANIRASVAALKKKYPESKAAERITGLVQTYGITGI